MNPEQGTMDFVFFQKQVDSLFQSEDTIPAAIVRDSTGVFRTRHKDDFRIELNGSDSAGLTRLPGIGPVFASRIIKYRRLLGGFYTVDQLKEVYGMKDENFARAIPHVFVNKGLLVTISVDTSEFRVLMRHPYIGKERTREIMNLRKRTGDISEDDLKNAGVFDSVQWERIKPYLIFQKNRLATN